MTSERMMRQARLLSLAAVLAACVPPASAGTLAVPDGDCELAPGTLVDVRSVDPAIRTDVRYATADNFTGAVLPGYERPLALLRPDAAQALGSLAAVHEHLGDHDAADENARKALALLEGREDFLDEIGQSNLVLGRSLLERGRLDEAEQCFRAADSAFEQMESIGHRTGAWVALGDLAERRGDVREAARWYRNAAEALQESRNG